MKIFKKGHVLKKSDLIGDTVIEKDFGHNCYILRIDGKKYVVSREGTCKPKNCDSACCRIISIRMETGINVYLRGFIDRQVGTSGIINRRCKNLSRAGSCVIWKNKRFPLECEQFPHPSDGVYLAVASVCTFRFVITEVVK